MFARPRAKEERRVEEEEMRKREMVVNSAKEGEKWCLGCVKMKG